MNFKIVDSETGKIINEDNEALDILKNISERLEKFT